MMWFSLLSCYVPDFVKPESLLLWERRMFWRACRYVYGDFIKAYAVTRIHENTRLLLIECKEAAK